MDDQDRATLAAAIDHTKAATELLRKLTDGRLQKITPKQSAAIQLAVKRALDRRLKKP